MPTIKQLLATKKITPLDAEVLLSFVLKKPKEFLYAHPEFQPTKKQISNFQFLISKRIKGEPIAYLTGHKEFFGLDFLVNKNVLIPRPETEILVEDVLFQISNNKYQITNIADVATGSGCIAISLKKHLPKLKIFATDISSAALNVAKKNAKRHKVKLNLFKGDLLTPIKNKKIDLLVANLPYLDIKHKNLLKSSETIGLKFEPKKALYAGTKGFDLFQKFFEQLNQRKQSPKYIFLEIGHNQATDLKKLIKKYLRQYSVKIKKDLAHLDRVLILKK